MDSNQPIHFKPVFYTHHPHLSITHNNKIISATTIPSLSLASSLSLVNTTSAAVSVVATTGTIGYMTHEANQLNALTTLQASSTGSLASSNSNNSKQMQLAPKTELKNLQPQQMQQQQQQNYVDQVNFRHQANKSAGTQHLQANIANQPPSIMTNTSGAILANHNPAQTATRNGSNNMPNETSSKPPAIADGHTSEIKSEPVTQPTSSQKKQTHQYGDVKMEASSGDNIINDLSKKYAIINNGKGFRCLVCSREFTQKGNLKTHAMTHLGPTERPYNCEICGKRFTQKGNRDIHVKIHTGTKDHTCPYCDRGFTQRGNLKTHIRSVHTGEKPFSCGHCGKTFSQKANMLTHFRTHDKNSRFACDVCGKTFSQKGNLKTHQQRHNQPPGI